MNNECMRSYSQPETSHIVDGPSATHDSPSQAICQHGAHTVTTYFHTSIMWLRLSVLDCVICSTALYVFFLCSIRFHNIIHLFVYLFSFKVQTSSFKDPFFPPKKPAC